MEHTHTHIRKGDDEDCKSADIEKGRFQKVYQRLKRDSFGLQIFKYFEFHIEWKSRNYTNSWFSSHIIHIWMNGLLRFSVGIFFVGAFYAQFSTTLSHSFYFIFYFIVFILFYFILRLTYFSLIFILSFVLVCKRNHQFPCE